jgi:hypothetical protein
VKVVKVERYKSNDGKIYETKDEALAADFMKELRDFFGDDESAEEAIYHNPERMMCILRNNEKIFNKLEDIGHRKYKIADDDEEEE